MKTSPARGLSAAMNSRGLTATKIKALWLFALFFFLSGLIGKINFSSLGIWSPHSSNSSEIGGLIAGKPRPIRSDEWFLGVPWLLSQVNSKPAFPVSNPSVGPDTAALAVGLPTLHWTAIFRPSHWGLYIFDTERGFSWFWLTRTVVCFAAITTLFLELLGGSLVLAITGAIWIFFSAFTQWWLASVAEVLLFFSMACVSFRWMLIADSWLKVLASSVMLTMSAVAFALVLYPPFQIPLAYLGVAIIPLLIRGSREVTGPSKLARSVCLLGSVIVGLVCVALFLLENTAVIRVMNETVYPGKRVSLGGGMTLVRYFSGVFEQLFNDSRFPNGFGNVCEASTGIILWPLSLLIMFFSTKRGAIALLTPLALYLVGVTIWAFWGVSETVANISLWSYVPLTRAFIGLSFGGAIFTLVVFKDSKRLTLTGAILFTVAAGLFFCWLAGEFHSAISGEFELWELLGAALVVFIIAAGFIWRILPMSVLGVVIACFYSHSLVNPIMSGMTPLLSIKLVKAAARFDRDSTGRWAVFGGTRQAQLVKVAGKGVINGSQYLPNLSLLRQLDPEGRSVEIYNRYAHIVFTVGDLNESLSFKLLAPDVWELRIDPCDPKFTSLDVDYIVLAPRPERQSFECFERIYIESDFAIYKRRV